MPDELAPEEFVEFVELKDFSDAWNDLALTDDDLYPLQLSILRDPKRWPVISGTGGLRKMRFSPPNWKRGKSGALRVCYAYFQPVNIVLLVLAYTKDEKDDLSNEEKKAIRNALSIIERQYLS